MPSFSLRRRHDPFWDIDGESARRSRSRQRTVAAVAFGLSWIVVAVAVLGWIGLVVTIPVPLGLDRLSTIASQVDAVFAPAAALPVIVLFLVVPAGVVVSLRLLRLQHRGGLAVV